MSHPVPGTKWLTRGLVWISANSTAYCMFIIQCEGSNYPVPSTGALEEAPTTRDPDLILYGFLHRSRASRPLSSTYDGVFGLGFCGYRPS